MGAWCWGGGCVETFEDPSHVNVGSLEIDSKSANKLTHRSVVDRTTDRPVSIEGHHQRAYRSHIPRAIEYDQENGYNDFPRWSKEYRSGVD